MNLSERCFNWYGKVVIDNYDYFEKQLIVSTFFHTILTVAATLGNGLIIVAILRSQNLQTPSYLLITSLAFTDLLIGLIYHPGFVYLGALFLGKNFHGACDERFSRAAFSSINTFVTGVSFTMNTLISIDRYLALSLRHRYRIHVTKKRVRMVIVAVWLGVGGYVFGVSQLRMYSTERYLPSAVLGVIILTLTCTFYILSFITLHRYTSQVHAQQPVSLHGTIDVVKYKKTLKTMVAILGCFLGCTIPGMVFILFFYPAGYSKDAVTGTLLVSIIFGANSSINPVIFLTRFRDMRMQCKNVLKKMRFC